MDGAIIRVQFLAMVREHHENRSFELSPAFQEAQELPDADLIRIGDLSVIVLPAGGKGPAKVLRKIAVGKMMGFDIVKPKKKRLARGNTPLPGQLQGEGPIAMPKGLSSRRVSDRLRLMEEVKPAVEPLGASYQAVAWEGGCCIPVAG
jgi:hypothetical protein